MLVVIGRPSDLPSVNAARRPVGSTQTLPASLTTTMLAVTLSGHARPMHTLSSLHLLLAYPLLLSSSHPFHVTTPEVTFALYGELLEQSYTLHNTSSFGYTKTYLTYSSPAFSV